ncbi:MAG TPA: hypothetical protein VKF15_03020 [Nitrososphaerales archaeon]|nr:hypothetical protein [Nitrososphaerales archaeon]
MGGPIPLYLVLLTDPPELPVGTTHLYLTYSSVSINVTSSGGLNQTFLASVEGTVDLTSLTNLTQTIASIAVPSGWHVTGVTLTIAGLHIFVNGTQYGVTPISSSVPIPVSQSTPINSSIAGSILDFSPAVEEVQVVNATNGQLNQAFVFTPGGIALGEPSLNATQATVGTVSNLTAKDSGRLYKLGKLYSRDLLVTSSQLFATGNKTTFSVTMLNNGSVTLPIYGISLKGQFNQTAVHYECSKNGKVCHETTHSRYRNSTIPFWINGTSLQPVLGSLQPGGGGPGSVYFLGPNKTVTFSFTGFIQALRQTHRGYNHIVLIPVTGDNYRLTVVGIGHARFHVRAT